MSVKIFEHISTVAIPECKEFFHAIDHFVVDCGNDSPVWIDFIDPVFDREFLLGDGTIEAPALGSILSCEKLIVLSKCYEILFELGMASQAEILLSEMFFLIKRQGHGQPGDLSVDGWWNAFFVHGCVVSARWNGKGWHFMADLIENSEARGADVLFFSHKLPGSKGVDILV